MRTTRFLLPALLLAFSFSTPTATRAAPRDTDLGRIVNGTHGTYYFPASGRGTEPWPVLIVEQGLADGQGKLWPLLAPKLKLIVVETKHQRSVAGVQDGGKTLAVLVDAALEEASSYHWRLNRCPWLPVGFSSIGTSTAQLVLSRPGRFQGLLLLNSGCEARGLPADLGAFAQFPVRILHGRNDSVYPAERAAGVEAHLRSAGLDVKLTLLEGDHMAPVREAGTEHIVAFLRLFDRFQTKDVLQPRWFESPDVKGRRTITTKAADGMQVTGDLYETGTATDPIVVLFHQASSGRGEYRLIAPRLVQAGFNCLAIDQRVGDGWGGVRNETAAGYGGKKQLGYHDARQDLDRAVAWAREIGFAGKLAVVGSSYSAALVFGLAADTPGIASLVSFSPGDYLQPKGSVFEAAGRVSQPTLVICPQGEEAQARKVFAAVSSEAKDLLILPQGVHGASTLYRGPDGEQAWQKLLAFLNGTLR